MKKRLLLVGFALLCITITTFGQQESTAGHHSPKEVVAIPSLKIQLEKINQKELQIQQATATSRGQLDQYKQERTVLLNDYKRMLTQELVNCAVDHVRTELEAELVYVEQQLIPVTNQR